MSMGLIGRKCGMSRVFTEDGESIPVTVVQVTPNRVTQLRTAESDGYQAVQVTTGVKRATLVNKPLTGHYAKAGTQAGRGLWEFVLGQGEGEALKLGAEIKVDFFTSGQKVDVSGTTQGKGFAGVIKRHNFHMQDATHGNSVSHRAPGSVGQCQTPGRVFRGKKMAGQMGNVRRTAQNLEVIRVDVELGMLLIKGAVPGPKGGNVVVRPAVKQR